MYRKPVLVLAAFVAAGAAFLSACGSQDAAAPTDQPDGVEQVDSVKGGQVTLTGTSVRLVEDKNLPDTSAAQALGGNDCVDLGRKSPASSLEADGTIKIWLGPNCTGESAIVKGKVNRLGKFDNSIQSIRFAPAKGAPTQTAPAPVNNGSNNGTAPGNTGNAALTATSAILDSGLNLSEPDGSQGVSGVGCVNVTRPTLVRSIQASGTYKIWKGGDCKGESKVVTGNVNDLGALGFDRQVASIRFAG
ncbi:hypothetical protein [Umezawaea sp. NPDC059074]|uniref:hypothetical protein n=1 Tax=Umezawaea sp. NPDC059074 TaxID=3346716 RepID=UPI003685A628